MLQIEKIKSKKNKFVEKKQAKKNNQLTNYSWYHSMRKILIPFFFFFFCRRSLEVFIVFPDQYKRHSIAWCVSMNLKDKISVGHTSVGFTSLMFPFIYFCRIPALSLKVGIAWGDKLNLESLHLMPWETIN